MCDCMITFQWTYTVGNSWGMCADGVGRVGCGPQETFRACSDFSITASDNLQVPSNGLASHAGASRPAAPVYHHQPPKAQVPSRDTVPLPKPSPSSCTPVGPYMRVPGMTDWCQQNCQHHPPHCPPSHCHCA